MKKLFLIFLGLSLMFSHTLLADGNNFIHYRSTEGLSFNNVDYLIEDDEGFIYAATLFGLNIFDGTNFTIFNHTNTPGFSNKIACVLPIKKGFILIGTFDKGLFIYNKPKGKITPVRTKADIAEVTMSITALNLDSNDNLWIGTEKGGLFCVAVSEMYEAFEQKRFSELTKVVQLSGSIHALISVESTIFAGDHSSIITRVKQEKSKFIVDQPLKIPKSEKSHVFSYHNNALLIGTDVGLFRVENLEKLDANSVVYLNTPWQLEGFIIRSISSNINADWVGTEGDGLFRLNRGKERNIVEQFTYSQNKRHGINSNYILCSMIDSNENLWVGTWFGGINQLDLKKDLYSFVYNENNENNIFANITWCLTNEKSDKYWVGTHGNGLCKYTIGDNNFTSVIYNNTLQSVSSIYYAQELDRLYIGTWGNGVQVFNSTRMDRLIEVEGVFDLLKSDRIYSITPDKFGNLWIGSFQNGLLYYNHEGGTLKCIKLLSDEGPKHPDVRSILYDPVDNVMWIGSLQQGLFKLTLSSDGGIVKRQHFNNFKLSDNVISVESLYLDSSRNLWILLRDGISVKFHDELNPTTLDHLEGLITTGITEDHLGNIWISSYQGLHMIDKSLKRKESFLDEYAFHAVISDSTNNTILAASDDGLVQVNPNLKLNKQAYPNILLSELRIFDQKIYPDTMFRGKHILNKCLNYSDTIILPPFSHTFSLQIKALSFSNTQKEKIRFQLKGFEKIWNEQVGTIAIATYTNVPPGTYSFLVNVADEYNNWNPESRELIIIKQKPWWSTNIALIIYTILLLSLLYMIYRMLKIRIVLRQELKFEKLKLSKDHELYQQKLRFFTNISHDVRTPLTLMLGPLEEMETSDDLPDKYRNKVTRALKNTKMLHNLFNQVLDFRKMETDNLPTKLFQLNLNKFAQYIFTQFYDLALSKKIDFELICPDYDIIIISDPQKLESIFFNLISNAIKFTHSYGQVFLEINTDDNNIIIQVKDTGVGIPENELNTVFTRFYRTNQSDSISKGTGIGLALVKSYVELLNGLITVKSIPGKETTFTITWPTRTDYEQFDIYKTDYPAKELSTNDQIQEVQDSYNTQNIEKVVVIDDNSDILEYLVEILNPHYKVYTALNGKEGLQLISRHHPALIICDIMMEGMDGIEVTQKIKSNLDTSHIPVILLTAKNTTDAKIEGYEKGADAYIEKPFNKTLLLTRIKTLIEHRSRLKKKFMVFDSPTDNVTPTSLDEVFLKKVIEKIENNITDSDFSVQGLVDEMDTTQDQLYRKIKALTGLSINHFIRSIRLKKAALLLRENRFNVGEVMFKVGFNNPSYFTRSFKTEFGVTPSKFAETKRSDK